MSAVLKISNKFVFAFISILTLITGCASTGDRNSEQALYDDLQEQLEKRNYNLAVERLDLIEELYPFGLYAEQIKLDRMFVTYQQKQYSDAAVLADRFTRLNPDHSGADYAYYLKARATFDNSFNQGNFFTGQHPERRDTSVIKTAYRFFESYLNRYPDGEFADDARMRMAIIKDRVARHELEAADFYMRKGAWLAAANRATFVIRHFHNTEVIPEALKILIKSYDEMGLEEEKARAEKIFEESFSGQS